MSWRLPKGWAGGSGHDPWLGPRLARIASLVPEGASVADVGTDHGLLPVVLVGSGRCPRAIAIDRHQAPLARAARAAARFEVQVDLRLGDGLVLSPGEASVAIIAGMGGRNVLSIVRARSPIELGIERLIVQPNTDFEEVRRALAKIGYGSASESFVADGDRFFLVMAFDRSAPRDLSLREAFLGSVTSDPLFGAWAVIQRSYWAKKSNDPAAVSRLLLLP